MLDMTLEQGQQVFLKALSGNNFSTESIRAYNADITQFVEFLKSVRVDWNNPRKIQRLDIIAFMDRLAGLRRSGTTRARKLASIRHFLKFLKENDIIAGNPAETITRVRIPVIPATQSGAKLPPNPKEACHPIRTKAAPHRCPIGAQRRLG